jgi:hypothetical protein
MYADRQSILAKDTGRCTGVSFGRSPIWADASIDRVRAGVIAARGTETG